jgi:hypothetical protein
MNRNNMRLAAVSVAVALVATIVTAGLVTGSGAAAAAAAPNNTSPPTISGSAEEGKTLTASRGSWSGSDPIDYNFAWKRCDVDGGSCSAISGAKSTTYTMKAVDAGNTLRVTVTAKNTDGSKAATSVPTAVVKAAVAPPPSNGCGKPSNGTIGIGDVAPPARLLIDQTQVSPSTITFGTDTVSARFHVTACAAAVQGALVYVTAVPYNQFSIPNEQQTGADGWASLELRRLDGFPATQKQQLLVMFVRARKSGENVLAGVSSRRLVSFRVTR